MLGNCKQANEENPDTVNVIKIHSLLYLEVCKPAQLFSRASGLYNNE
jgi:hypothetical protein